MSILVPGADELEKSVEKAEDHLSAVVTTQMIPALIKGLSELISSKRVTITFTIEDKK